MRRKDREITDIHKIEKILSSAKYLHLGVLDDESHMLCRFITVIR